MSVTKGVIYHEAAPIGDRIVACAELCDERTRELSDRCDDFSRTLEFSEALWARVLVKLATHGKKHKTELELLEGLWRQIKMLRARAEGASLARESLLGRIRARDKLRGELSDRLAVLERYKDEAEHRLEVLEEKADHPMIQVSSEPDRLKDIEERLEIVEETSRDTHEGRTARYDAIDRIATANERKKSHPEEVHMTLPGARSAKGRSSAVIENTGAPPVTVVLKNDSSLGTPSPAYKGSAMEAADKRIVTAFDEVAPDQDVIDKAIDEQIEAARDAGAADQVAANLDMGPKIVAVTDKSLDAMLNEPGSVYIGNKGALQLLKAHQESGARLQRKVGELRARLCDLEVEGPENCAGCETLRADNLKMATEVTTAEMKYDTARGERKQLEQVIGNLKHQARQVERERNEVADTLRKTERERDDHQAGALMLVTKLSKVEHERDRLLGERDSLKAGIAAAMDGQKENG